MSDKFDVAIVGGSIAGCTAATFFARQGLRVALLERNADPNAYKKVCTHYIQPCALPTLQRLRLAERIEAAGGVRNGVELWTRWGWIRFGLDERFPPHGYNIRREKLDPIGLEWISRPQRARGSLTEARRRCRSECTLVTA